MIRWANPRAQYDSHQASISAAISRVVNSNDYILGRELYDFEERFSAYIGTRYAIGVSSGLDALILALKALGIGPGDEVITVAFTAPATVQAIMAVGAIPVCVDVGPADRVMRMDEAVAAVTRYTKAIIPVHLYGRPCAMDGLSSLQIPIIEDCAQATGATYHGRRVGSIGAFGCFSFYPTKNLGAIGDGGMVMTDDLALALKVLDLRLSHRLDPLQAAILGVKLATLDADNERRRAIARRYNAQLPAMTSAAVDDGDMPGHVFHLYAVTDSDRDGLRAHLRQCGIECGIHYAQPALPCDLPQTQYLCNHVLSLPIYPELGDDDVDRVIAACHGFESAASSPAAA